MDNRTTANKNEGINEESVGGKSKQALWDMGISHQILRCLYTRSFHGRVYAYVLGMEELN